MNKILVKKLGEAVSLVQIENEGGEAQAVRVYRHEDGSVAISWPMRQDVNARTARLYAESLLIAARMAEDLEVPCPKCGGMLELHPLMGPDKIIEGHVYRCTACGEVVQ